MTILRPPIGTPQDSYEWQTWFIRIAEEYKRRSKVVTKTSDYSLEADVFLVRVDATSAGVTVTLPPAASFPGRQVYMKKIDVSANAATLDGNGSEVIDGATTKATTTQYAVIGVISNGSSWDQIEG